MIEQINYHGEGFQSYRADHVTTRWLIGKRRKEEHPEMFYVGSQGTRLASVPQGGNYEGRVQFVLGSKPDGAGSPNLLQPGHYVAVILMWMSPMQLPYLDKLAPKCWKPLTSIWSPFTKISPLPLLSMLNVTLLLSLLLSIPWTFELSVNVLVRFCSLMLLPAFRSMFSAKSWVHMAGFFPKNM